MSFFNKIKETVTSGAEDLSAQISKLKNKKFMQATVAICAAISMASEGSSAEEKQVMERYFKQSNELKDFDMKEVMEFFTQLVDAFELDKDIGFGEAIKYISPLKDKPDMAQLAMRVGIAVANCDGDFDQNEKDAARKICTTLGLNPADYQL